MKKRLFDLIFIIISASILVAFSEYGFLEKNMAFSLIPILMAYYLGQYSHIWFKK
jgi:predicted membrane protein